jgi:phosphopantothenoylcysteine decarboxylase / phosphopantothenate---cysteine ligase
MLHGKKILLGVCGSIAAYKAALLVRLLVKQEAEVRVILTTSASAFITPLTLSTLSKYPVYTDFFKADSGEWTNHVELGLWADAMVIAPASANTLGKMANGICDNLLLATYLSARCPVWVAPAMDLDMYRHPSTVANLQKLESYGNRLIDAEEGELASGLSGQGRMAEPETIVRVLDGYFSSSRSLAGKRVIVTAGPTFEALDPVRFIGNHSTGKMGYALAEAFATQGAEVVLVSGPTALFTKHPSIEIVRVQSATEMLKACQNEWKRADLAVMAAAVADYAPTQVSPSKIKKNEDTMMLELKKNPDIAQALGTSKQAHQVLVGFALETDHEEANARAKLKKKNFDMIVLNSLNDQGAGFGHDTNKVQLIFSDNTSKDFELMTKQQVAEEIVHAIARRFYA